MLNLIYFVLIVLTIAATGAIIIQDIDKHQDRIKAMINYIRFIISNYR